MTWGGYLLIALYVLWGVMALLVLKLLIVRKRWRHPLRGNGPMLTALLLILVNTQIGRARRIAADVETPPPYLPSVVVIVAATLLILWWLWRQMELIPRWIREHIPWRRTRADYTLEEHDHHADQR